MRGAIESAAPGLPGPGRAKPIPRNCPDLSLTGSAHSAERPAPVAQIASKSHPKSTSNLTSIFDRFFSDLAPILAPFGDHFGSILAPKSTLKSILIWTAIRIRFFIAFGSQMACPTWPGTSIFALPYSTFGIFAFFVLNASWSDFGSILAPFCLPCWLHLDDFFVKNVS